MSTTYAAGHEPTADEFPGRVARVREVTFNTYTTAELLVTSVQFNAVAGLYYKCSYRGSSEGDTVANGIKSQMRWKFTNTIDLTGTVLDSTQTYVDTINHTIGNVWLLDEFQAVSTGTHTVVVSIQRSSGAGNVKANCTVIAGVLLVEVY